MVATLMTVTGIEDVDFVREFLQDNDCHLETSVNAYMMMIGQDGDDGGMGTNIFFPTCTVYCDTTTKLIVFTPDQPHGS